MIESIRLVPVDGHLRIDRRGELGAILAAADEKPASLARGGRSTLVVAGTRSQRCLQLIGCRLSL